MLTLGASCFSRSSPMSWLVMGYPQLLACLVHNSAPQALFWLLSFQYPWSVTGADTPLPPAPVKDW